MSGFWSFLDLEQPHQSVQIFYLFCKKTILFLFYTPIFTKHPHQFVYSTIYFIQIIIFLTFLLLFPFSPTTLPNSPKYFLHSLSLYFPPSSCSFFFLFFFFFSFSFLHLQHLHLLLLILILILILLLFLFLFEFDYG